jgi:UDP-N-acetylglucosamine 2-epimerase
MRVFTVVGNRPQFIKSAPLSIALRKGGVEEITLHTGQHYDPELSQVFYDELDLAEPTYRLENRSAEPERMVPGICEAVVREQPDWVLVYGDTNSTLAGALAAGEVPLAHVEAGLRSFDLSMPEERNRIAVDRISALLLCPDERSARQLESEGVPGLREVVGDVMADANRIFAPIARERSDVLERLGVEPRGYVVATIHREANVAPERLTPIVAGLAALDRPVLFPAHPRTRSAIEQHGIAVGGHLTLLEPLGYLDLTALVSQAAVVVTDSGGLQKEAYWQRVPCVTVRPSTEWVDTLTNGANVLVEPQALVGAVETALRGGFPDDAPPLYGDGYASELITAALYAWRP